MSSLLMRTWTWQTGVFLEFINNFNIIKLRNITCKLALMLNPHIFDCNALLPAFASCRVMHMQHYTRDLKDSKSLLPILSSHLILNSARALILFPWRFSIMMYQFVLKLCSRAMAINWWTMRRTLRIFNVIF